MKDPDRLIALLLRLLELAGRVIDVVERLLN